MIVEMNYGTVTPGGEPINVFQSALPASEIISAYKSGKNITLHFPPEETIQSYEAAVSIVGYYAYIEEYGDSDSPIIPCDIVTLGPEVNVGSFVVIDDTLCLVIPSGGDPLQPPPGDGDPIK